MIAQHTFKSDTTWGNKMFSYFYNFPNSLLGQNLYYQSNKSGSPPSPPESSYIVTESGSRIITENGDYMITEGG